MPATPLARLALVPAALLAGLAPLGCQPAAPAPAPTQVRATESDLDAWRSLGFELDWSVSGRAGANVEAIAPEGDVVIIVDEQSVVTAREDDTGAIRWSIQVTSPTEQFFNAVRVPNYEMNNPDGSVTAADAVLVTSSTEIFAYDLVSGAILERYREPLTISTPLIVDRDRMIYGTAAGRLQSKRMINGVTKWSYRMEGPVEGTPVRLRGGLIGAVSNGGEVLITDTLSGASVSGPVSIFGGIDTEPITNGFTMFIASVDHSIYAFDAASGQRRWRVRTPAPLREQPALYGNALLVTTATGMTAYNSRNGDELWSNADVRGEAISSIRGDVLVFTGDELILVDPDTGGIVDRKPAGVFREFHAAGFEDADIYGVAPGGAVTKFTAR